MPRTRPPIFKNSVVLPIYHTASYFFSNSKQVRKYQEGREKAGRYGRYDNPSWLEVESELAALDRADQALLFPSGMNAIATILLTFLRAGDRCLYTGRGYRNIRNLCSSFLPRYGIEAVSVPVDTPTRFRSAFAKAYTANTRIVFLECPSNPHLYVPDILFVKSQVRANTLIVVDSTLASPINLQPITLGADLVVHSCGKYIAGHADIMAGSVAGSSGLIEQVRVSRNVLGGIPDPHTAFLLRRSMHSLELRMQYLNEAGARVARILQAEPKVARVFYPGLTTHPHAHLAREFFHGHGSVLAFELRGSSRGAMRFVDSLQIPFMATHFGGPYSHVEQCSFFTYYKETVAERKRLGVSDNLIRLSLGFEPIAKIIADLRRAFRLV
jgi:cystathionine gamma-synthase